MIGYKSWIKIVLVNDPEVERLEKVIFRSPHREIVIYIGNIPLYITTLHHSLELAIVDRSILQDCGSRFRKEWLCPCFGLGFLSCSTPTDKNNFLALRRGMT